MKCLFAFAVFCVALFVFQGFTKMNTPYSQMADTREKTGA